MAFSKLMTTRRMFHRAGNIVSKGSFDSVTVSNSGTGRVYVGGGTIKQVIRLGLASTKTCDELKFYSY